MAPGHSVVLALVCLSPYFLITQGQIIRYVNETVPTYGPIAGGTFLTLQGGNFSGLSSVTFISDTESPVECSIYQKFNDTVSFRRFNDTLIRCVTSNVSSDYVNLTLTVRLYFENNSTFDGPETFTYGPNPVINAVTPLKTIERGGTRHAVTGENLDSVFKPQMTLTLVVISNGHAIPYPQHHYFQDIDDHGEVASCDVVNNTLMYCLAPPTQHQITTSHNADTGFNKDHYQFYIGFTLDGHDVHKNFSIMYVFANPDIHDFPGNNDVLPFKVYKGQERIEISGDYLNFVAAEEDYKITVGEDGVCEVEEVITNQITCRPPQTRPTVGILHSNGEPNVHVEVFFLDTSPGYLKYEEQPFDDPDVVIITAVCCSVGPLLIIIIAVVVVKWKKRQLREDQRPVLDGDPRYTRPQTLTDRVPHDLKIVLDPCMREAARLKIGKALGEGNFGAVHAGKFIADDNKTLLVACKTLKESGVTKEEFREFLEEATLMRDFAHDNVLSLVGVVFKEGRPWVLLPYMENGDLRSYLLNSNNCFTVANLIDYGQQAAKGMAYLEEIPCVHRDLAARNCMISKENVLKIADFGLARDIFQDEYYRVGTMTRPLPVKWMAPECLDEHKFTCKSDVWSYGVLFWETLTRGKRPYSHVGNYDLKPFLLTGRRLEKPEAAPDEIYEVMLECWRLNPRERPSFREIDTRISEILAIEEEQAVVAHSELGTRSTTVDLYQNLNRYVDMTTDRPHAYERLSVNPNEPQELEAIDYKAGAKEFDNIEDPHDGYLPPRDMGDDGYLPPVQTMTANGLNNNSFQAGVAVSAPNGVAVGDSGYEAPVVSGAAYNGGATPFQNPGAYYHNMAAMSGHADPERVVIQT